MLIVISIAQLLLDVFWWLIVIQVILSWLLVFNVLNTQHRSLWLGEIMITIQQ